MTTITASQLLTGIYAGVGILLLVVLYHTLFIVVDMRKISRRCADLSERFEAALLVPLELVEHGLAWLVEYIDYLRNRSSHHHVKHTAVHAKRRETDE